MKSAGAAPLSAPVFPTRRPAGARVLVVSDDPLVHSVIVPTLRHAGVHVEIAAAGTRRPPGADASAFDLVLVGRSLPRDESVEVLAAPHVERQKPPHRPGCAAERWAALVLKVSDADADLKTLGDWAAFVGMSQSSLCECCRLVDVRPHAARDLARVLRVVIRSSADNGDPAALLDVRDRRTLRRLLTRGGIEDGLPASVDIFLERQTLVRRSNAALIALRHLLGAA